MTDKELEEKLEEFQKAEAWSDAERVANRKALEAKGRQEILKRERDEALAIAKQARQDLSDAQVELALYQRVWEEQPKWLKPPPKKDPEHHGTLVASFSDSHYAEFVDPEQMDGYNAYDLEIASIRTRVYFEKVIMLARDFLAGVRYDGVVLALGGDLVSGTIHDELERTNLLSNFKATEFAFEQLVPGIEMWLEEFGNVHMVSVPGNHGRTKRKPEAKGYSEDNADQHIARLIARHFQGQEGYTATIPEADDADFMVYSRRFSAEHGHNFKSAGSPEIGSIGPITRGTLRKQAQKTAEGKAFDYALNYHFHQYIPGRLVTTNGSVKGFDEFARGSHFRPEPAIQALQLVTPEHGITIQTPVILQNREREKW